MRLEIQGITMTRLTPAQRRDYLVAVKNGTTANEIMAELAKLEEEKK